jgi:hypothetical protein
MLASGIKETFIRGDGRVQIGYRVADMMDLRDTHSARQRSEWASRGLPRRKDQMGFLDKIKQQATDVASTVVEKTQETAKTGQLQMQLRNLRNEEKEAFEALGRAAHRLHRESRLGEDSSELDAAAGAVADVQSRISDKEAEIAAVKEEEAPAGGDTVESSAEEVVDTPPPPPTDTNATAGGDRPTAL